MAARVDDAARVDLREAAHLHEHRVGSELRRHGDHLLRVRVRVRARTRVRVRVRVRLSGRIRVGVRSRGKGIGRGGATDRVEVRVHLAERVHRDEPHLG